MRKVVRLAGVMMLASAAAGLAASGQAEPVAAAARSAADQRLKALYDGYAAWDAGETANFQNAAGETKPTDRLPKIDAATQQRRAAHLQELLTQLNAIPEAQLSAEEKVNAAVFRTVLENASSELRFRLWERPFIVRPLARRRRWLPTATATSGPT